MRFILMTIIFGVLCANMLYHSQLRASRYVIQIMILIESSIACNWHQRQVKDKMSDECERKSNDERDTLREKSRGN